LAWGSFGLEISGWAHDGLLICPEANPPVCGRIVPIEDLIVMGGIETISPFFVWP
jgi:hypothetical protein